jgi:hypothetical protein
MVASNLLGQSLGALTLGISFLGWLLFLLDPVLVVFALYAGIFLAGIYSLFPKSNVYIYTSSIFACVVVTVAASHHNVKEGFAPPTIESLKNSFSLIIPPLIVSVPLVIISVVRKLRSSSRVLKERTR